MVTRPDLSSAGVSGNDIVSFALAQRGDPYVWGAEGPDAFDCSGLVEYVYHHFGLTTPRTTAQMMASNSPLQPITRKDLQPGDLIFSNWIGTPHSHVGIFTGRNTIVEAPEPGRTVTETPLGPGYWSHVDALRRVPGTDAAVAGAVGGAIGNTTVGSGTQLGAVGNELAGWIPNPGSITDALTNIGTGIGNAAQSVAHVGEFASILTRALLPSNLLRGAFLMFGLIFVMVGIWFLAGEIKESKQ